MTPKCSALYHVVPGLVPGTHAVTLDRGARICSSSLKLAAHHGVGARDKRGHDVAEVERWGFVSERFLSS
jgi:hypothetical protein